MTSALKKSNSAIFVTHEIRTRIFSETVRDGANRSQKLSHSI